MNSSSDKSQLFFGDNLEILRLHIPDESVDLVYLDPPFNSDADYNVLFRDRDGNRSPAQIQAFEDTWTWDKVAVELYQETVEQGGQIAQALVALRQILGTSNLLAYLVNMAPRLVEMHRVLKPSGSLFLHCDPTASHYLKVLLDAIFGPENYINEIIWRRTGRKSPRRSFGRVHDVIHAFGKTGDYKFNLVRVPYMRGHVESRYTEDAQGRMCFSSGGNVLTGPGASGGPSGEPWRGFEPSASDRHWAIPSYYDQFMPESYQELDTIGKLEALYQAGHVEIVEGNKWPKMVRYLNERDGTVVQDIWAYEPYTEGTVWGTEAGIDADVQWLGPTAPERLGYPTQKPEGLLERIIRATTDEGDVVLDPFCGCGTTITVSQRLHRRWIGIDVTHLAVMLMKHRLRNSFGINVANSYEVRGEPTTVEAANQLAKQDRFQFQYWALGLVDARPAEPTKGPDGGIDGRIFFHDESGGPTREVVLSVKSGATGVKDVRDLRGVIEREKAAMGVLITLQPSTRDMRAEAADAGIYESKWGQFPRLQILTIDALLEGARIHMPPSGSQFPEAQRHTELPDQASLI